MTSVYLGDRDATVQARSAIILYHSSYREGGGDGVRFALQHPIVMTPTGSSLGAGVPLDGATLFDALMNLMDGKSSNSGFLPSKVLSISPSHLAWWRPPSVRTVYLMNTPLSVPHPGLVFVAFQGELYVGAVKGAARPEPDDVIHEAPYLNMYKGGRMCRGDVQYPDGTIAENIKAWEDSFFDSRFTHGNSHELVNCEGNLTGLWQGLRENRWEVFPEEVLVPMKSEGQTRGASAARTVSEFVTITPSRSSR